MTGTAVRQIYEKRPYPDPRSSPAPARRWLLPPSPWINAMWPRSHPLCRILVAGCGSGSEAFAMQRKFPAAKVIGVDFSPRSIGVAKQTQRKHQELRKIRFLVADLSSASFKKVVGDNFDFVSCHGVASYIEKPERALRNLRNCLRSDGALYLGVNGQTHFSTRWRQELPQFGIDIMEFQDARPVRQKLRLFDALCGAANAVIAKEDPEYLAGDLFGPLLHNWPLADWIRPCRKNGLHLLASYSIFHGLRPTFDPDLNRLLIPRSRTQVLQIFEVLRPSSFHRLILSRQPEIRPPWQDTSQLSKWRPMATDLYVRRWPKRLRSWKTIRPLTLTSSSTNTIAELRVQNWEIELFRRANGKHSIEDLVPPPSARVSDVSVRDALYLLYHLGAINLLPPADQ
jgi:SAM-dependent methyltransferase